MVITFTPLMNESLRIVGLASMPPHTTLPYANKEIFYYQVTMSDIVTFVILCVIRCDVS